MPLLTGMIHLIQRMVGSPEQNHDSSPVITEVLGKASDVPPGTKKEFKVREKPILVINDNGKFYATSGLCSHYDYPLEKGIYSRGKIRCALHGACFNVKTGDIEDYPGFDSIHTYDVKEQDGDLILNTTEKELESSRRTRMCAIKTLTEDAPIIVVGGGVSASAFVEHARLNGCSTPITMITEDENPPYDRVKLSKKPAVEVKDIRLRCDDYYKENHIDILTNTQVTGVDTIHRNVTLSTGEQKPYSKLVLALGGTPRKLPIPGSDLKNVYTLRVVSDANTIAAHSAGKHVVCIGGSFIGMEIASALSSTAASVTVVCMTESHFRHWVLILVLLSKSVSRPKESKCETIPADVVVAGIGVQPPTAWLKNTRIELNEAGFINVDRHFRTSVDWIYAIGDVVSAPLPLWDIDSVNIQHFQTAQTHGQLLAYSIVGHPFPHEVVPFFWTLFFSEFGLRFAGCSVGAQHTIIHGSLAELNFAKYYLKDDVVVAVASAGPIPTAIQFLEIFKRKIDVTREDVEKNTSNDWLTLLDE
uniref:Rieske domain-containing protein n=2 Tax=Haemonchus contortus TaxID=6289 RepID=A0A7I4YVU7_HAECO